MWPVLIFIGAAAAVVVSAFFDLKTQILLLRNELEVVENWVRKKDPSYPGAEPSFKLNAEPSSRALPIDKPPPVPSVPGTGTAMISMRVNMVNIWDACGVTEQASEQVNRQALAECLAPGAPLAGKMIELVGHYRPEDPDGAIRAYSAAQDARRELVRLGISQDQIQIRTKEASTERDPDAVTVGILPMP